MRRLSRVGRLKRPLRLEADDLLLFARPGNELRVQNLTWAAHRSLHSGPEPTNDGPASGAAILSAAKDRVCFVMRCMPGCRAGVGRGARAAELGDLSGLAIQGDHASIANLILLELLAQGKIKELAEVTTQDIAYVTNS